MGNLGLSCVYVYGMLMRIYQRTSGRCIGAQLAGIYAAYAIRQNVIELSRRQTRANPLRCKVGSTCTCSKCHCTQVDGCIGYCR